MGGVRQDVLGAALSLEAHALFWRIPAYPPREVAVKVERI